MRVYLDCKDMYPCDVRALAGSHGISLSYAPISCDYIAIADRSIGRKTVWELPINDTGRDETGEVKWTFEPDPKSGICRGIVCNAIGQEIGTYELFKLIQSENKDDSIVVTLEKI